jgi:malonyl-CoA O-methyltransferase
VASLSSDPGPGPSIDLNRVRRLFDAPNRISDSAFLRREVASRMQERLELVKIAPSHVLDAGCGDGADLAVLQQAYAGALTIGLDASPAMLRKAQGEHAHARSALRQVIGKWLKRGKGGKPPAAPELLCGDFAQLPLAAGTVDLIWSNLALHWHSQPQHVFEEWRRVLRTDGLLMFSCFGPDTLKELRAAFAQLDTFPHVLSFADMHDIGDMLVHAGFSTPVMDMETITVTYADLGKLLSEVRAFGGNPLISHRCGLIGRDAWKRMVDALEAARQPDSRLPLTFEIIYGHAFRPAPRKTAAGEAIVRFEPRKR